MIITFIACIAQTPLKYVRSNARNDNGISDTRRIIVLYREEKTLISGYRLSNKGAGVQLDAQNILNLELNFNLQLE